MLGFRPISDAAISDSGVTNTQHSVIQIENAVPTSNDVVHRTRGFTFDEVSTPTSSQTSQAIFAVTLSEVAAATSSETDNYIGVNTKSEVTVATSSETDVAVFVNTESATASSSDSWVDNFIAANTRNETISSASSEVPLAFYSFNAAAGNISITGVTIGLSLTFDLESGSYNYESGDSGLHIGQLIKLGVESYITTGFYTGQNIQMNALPGTINVSGVEMYPKRTAIYITPVGEYTVQGYDLDNDLGLKFNAEAGTYDLSGVSATNHIAENALPTTLNIVGVNTTQSLSVVELNGVYVLSGAIASNHLKINHDAGAIAITGSNAATTKQYVIQAVAGTFNVLGVNSKSDIGMPLDAGDYAHVGVDMEFDATRSSALVSGVYTVTGVATTSYRGKAINASSGMYNVYGNDSFIDRTIGVSANAGDISISGYNTVDYKQSKIAALAGSYSVNGVDSLNSHQNLLITNQGTFNITGAAISGNIKTVSQPGVINLSGNAAVTKRDALAPIDANAFSYVGAKATITRFAQLITTADPIALVTPDASLLASRVIKNNSISSAFAGSSINNLYDRVSVVDPSSYGITAAAVTNKLIKLLKADSDTISLDGGQASVTRGRLVKTDTERFIIYGNRSDLKTTRFSSLDAQPFIVSGASSAPIANRKTLLSKFDLIGNGVTAQLSKDSLAVLNSTPLILNGISSIIKVGRSLKVDNFDLMSDGLAARLSKDSLGALDSIPYMAQLNLAALLSNIVYLEPGTINYDGTETSLIVDRIYYDVNSHFIILYKAKSTVIPYKYIP